MDQNIWAYMIKLRTNKWWWPLFRFVVYVAVNKAYQIYYQFYLNPGEYRLDALGFRWAIANAYYHLYKNSLLSITLFTSSCSSNRAANNLQFDSINHWIPKGSQRLCSFTGCKGTLVYYCKKNTMSVFVLIFFNYIPVVRAVCKVCIR